VNSEMKVGEPQQLHQAQVAHQPADRQLVARDEVDPVEQRAARRHRQQQRRDVPRLDQPPRDHRVPVVDGPPLEIAALLFLLARRFDDLYAGHGFRQDRVHLAELHPLAGCHRVELAACRPEAPPRTPR
jgi:hypothetical protein